MGFRWPWVSKATAGEGGASSPPATADLQDPIPESSWLWRRVVFVGSWLLRGGFSLWIFWEAKNAAVVALTTPSADNAIALAFFDLAFKLALVNAVVDVIERILYTV